MSVRKSAPRGAAAVFCSSVIVVVTPNPNPNLVRGLRLLPYANELRERLVATDITPSVTVLAASSTALASRLTAAWQRAVGVVEQLCGVLEAEDRSLRAVLSLKTCTEHR